MASQTAIANRALTKLGAARILSLTDDVESARVINSMWDIVREAELRSKNWNFSITRTSLAALLSAPSWGYDHAYQLPSDCLKVIQVGEYFPGVSLTDFRSSNEAEYQIEGQNILSNLDAPLKIRYVADITDTGLWDSLFVEAFASRLAYESCEAITQSNSKKKSAENDYIKAIREAVRADAIENPPEPLPDDTWMMSRL